MFTIVRRRPWRFLALAAVAGAVPLCLLLPRDVRGRVWGMVVGKPARPMVWVDPPRHDFGRVKPLTTVKTVFRIENRGGRTLRIQPPTASCGCQKPTIDKATLGPGESTTLRVEQQARESIGPSHQMIFLKTNDPLTPEVMIPMSLVVTKGVIVRPEPLYLGDVAAGTSQTRTVEIVADDGVPFRLKYCAAGGGNALDADAELDVARLLHRISVTFRGSRRLGPFEERLVVNADHAGTAPLIIPVRGRVTGPYSVSPSILTLGNVPGLSESEVSLVVAGRAEEIRVDGVEIHPDGWSVRRDDATPEGSRRRVLKLKIRVPNAMGVIDGGLDVRLSGDKAGPAVITVPIVAAVRTATGLLPADPQ